jgi:hypothetical protein
MGLQGTAYSMAGYPSKPCGLGIPSVANACSAQQSLAFLGTALTGFGAGLAGGMVIFMFAASFLARLAGIQSNAGKRAGQVGLLVGQALQGTTQRQNLVDRLRTLGHGLVALTQQYKAMGQAGLCFADAICRSTCNTLVRPSAHGPGCLHLGMVMRLCVHLRARANSQGSGYSGKRIASLHGISLKNTNLPRNHFRLKNRAWFQHGAAHGETPPIGADRKRKEPARP